LNTYSAGKNIPDNVIAQGGKRLDYIFYRQPAVARRRPLIWGYRDDYDGDEVDVRDGWGSGGLEEGKPMSKSMDRAPTLRCISSEVVLTEKVPGQRFSYSDHFALYSVFAIDVPPKREKHIHHQERQEEKSETTFTPLVPLLNETEDINDTTTTFAPISPPSKGSTSPRISPSSASERSSIIRNALITLRLYTGISESIATTHLRYFVACVVGLVALTVGSAWQPKKWIQPIFTLLGGALGAGGATMLYTGFVWGRWEKGLLTEVIEEMELELRVVEMEERAEEDI
jgi:sphingomyelin phosphodiesterase 2